MKRGGGDRGQRRRTALLRDHRGVEGRLTGGGRPGDAALFSIPSGS
ncbi:hypothetical protein ACU686_19115 [Yinghuangia aomiensis]